VERAIIARRVAGLTCQTFRTFGENLKGSRRRPPNPVIATVRTKFGLYLVHNARKRGGSVRYSSQVKPISYLKSHAAEILRTLSESREPVVITQNGEARAVLQDVASYEETQETLALLKLLALGNRDIETGKVTSVEAAVERIRSGRRAAP